MMIILTSCDGDPINHYLQLFCILAFLDHHSHTFVYNLVNSSISVSPVLLNQFYTALATLEKELGAQRNQV